MIVLNAPLRQRNLNEKVQSALLLRGNTVIPNRRASLGSHLDSVTTAGRGENASRHGVFGACGETDHPPPSALYRATRSVEMDA